MSAKTLGIDAALAWCRSSEQFMAEQVQANERLRVCAKIGFTRRRTIATTPSSNVLKFGVCSLITASAA